MKKMNSYDRSLRLAQQLVAASPDANIRALALRLQSRLTIPMAKILERVPGKSVAERARSINVTRQTWYNWVRGDGRPNIVKARELQRVTGYTVLQIRGGEEK